jgi:hypothetical protein
MVVKSLMLRVAHPGSGTVSYSFSQEEEKGLAEIQFQSSRPGRAIMVPDDSVLRSPIGNELAGQILHISEFLSARPAKLLRGEHVDINGPSYCLIVQSDQGFRATECFTGTRAGEVCQHLESLMKRAFVPGVRVK